MEQQPNPARPRLNLFAFPSLTTLLFALIAGVILIAVLAGLRQNPGCLGPVLIAGMTLLPLRDLLRQPEKRLRAWGLADAEPPPEAWKQEMAEAAAEMHVSPPPQLLIAPRSLGPTTVGSWRRRYVVIGQPQAEQLARLDAETRRALWLHEAAHFANGDHWKVGLARSLLQTSVMFMGWVALFFLGMIVMTYLYLPHIFAPGYLDTLPLDPATRQVLTLSWPDPAQLAAMAETFKNVDFGLVVLYTLYAPLPFVLSSLVLRLSVWRRLVQVREFYADARTAAHLGSAEHARRALIRAATDLSLSADPAAPTRKQLLLDRLQRTLARRLPVHPSWAERATCLRDPIRVFGDWKWAGLTAGLTVLLLQIILTGPFTMSYLNAGPAHFATLTGFLILALWLLPGVCLTPTTGRPVFQAALLFITLPVGWLLLNTALLLPPLLIAPGLAAEPLKILLHLQDKILIPSPIPGLPQDPTSLVLMALSGAWAFAALELAVLLLGVLLIFFLFRRLLTWYAFPGGRRLLRVAWGAILVVALGLGFLILPPPTALIQGDWTYLLRPSSLLPAIGIALVLLISGGWFLYTDRRYGRQCPACRSPVPGPFTLGRQCPACGQVLHPWLLAED